MNTPTQRRATRLLCLVTILFAAATALIAYATLRDYTMGGWAVFVTFAATVVLVEVNRAAKR